MRSHKTSDNRNKLYARVHIALKALGIDDASYREMLLLNWGVPSAKNLMDPDLHDLVNKLEAEAKTGAKALAWRDFRPPLPGRPAAADGDGSKAAQLRKIEVLLCRKAARQGKPITWAYAHGMARQMYGVDKIDWCHSAQLRGIITGLEKHLAGSGSK